MCQIVDIDGLVVGVRAIDHDRVLALAVAAGGDGGPVPPRPPATPAAPALPPHRPRRSLPHVGRS